MDDRHIKLKDAIEVVRETVADEYIESTLELRLLDKSLTADVVEVVRCKDCKYYVLHTLFGHTQGWCERLCDEFDRSLAHGTEVDDYCSYGERAEE